MVGYILKWIWYKLLINMVGAWYLVREQVWDRHRRLPSLPRQEGRLVVVTGGGRGIGEQAVRRMVSLGARVIIGVRSPETVKTKFSDCGGEREGGVTVLELDLCNMDSVRKFAGQVLELNQPINVLINNAGIMFGSRRETQEGFEYQLCTNYLGHFLLTHLLLPLLVTGGSAEQHARIVNVSSCAHLLGSWLDLTDFQLKKMYFPEQAYGNSKACQILFTGSLTRLLQERRNPVRVYSLHPGVVYSGLYSNIPGFKCIGLLAQLVMKSVKQGSDTLVQAALDPSLESQEGGLYLVNSRPTDSSAFTRDHNNQNLVWKETCTLLGLDTHNYGISQ